MFFIIISVLLASVFFLFYLYQSSRRNYWTSRGVPFGSGCHWFFGHYKEFFFQQKQIGLIFQDLYNEFPQSPYVGYMKMGTPGLAIRDPDLIKAVLSTDYNNFAENEIKLDKKNDCLTGNNPFFLTGSEWKAVRGHATPLTTFVKLKSYYPTMKTVADEMIRYVKNKCETQKVAELETKKLSGMYTTDIVANAALGVQNNTFEDENSLFAQIVGQIFTNGAVDNAKIFFSIALPKLSPHLGLRFASKRIEEELISLTQRQMSRPSVPGQSRHDIFQQMKIYRDNDKTGVFSDEYIASHCFSFLTDGYETSSDLLCFVLFELAWHSEVQDRLREEIMNMIEETRDDYNVDHIEKLKYLDMIVCETLRLYPPATTLAKMCSIDYKVPNSSLVINKGTPVTIPVFAIQNDEKYYENVAEFIPERFTEEAVAERNKFVYLPFGEGPRKCPGQRFALLQVKLAILSIVKNFLLKPSPKTKFPVELDPTFFISRPKDGAWIQFEIINNNPK